VSERDEINRMLLLLPLLTAIKWEEFKML